MNDNFSNTKNAIINYFKGVRTEWGKITWPEKHHVVAIVYIFSVFIYFVDIIFNALLSGLNYQA